MAFPVCCLNGKYGVLDKGGIIRDIEVLGEASGGKRVF